jgi:putative transposase
MRRTPSVNGASFQNDSERVTDTFDTDSVTSRPSTPFLTHTGQVLERAVTFRFALDPNLEQEILLTKCAGARRFTVNHHYARVKANLDVRAAERASCLDPKSDPELLTSSLSWSGFSFINEFNAWKNGTADNSLVDDDGHRGLSWRNEVPSDVFECASVDAARALENFAASRRSDRKATVVGFPRFQASGKVTPSFRLRNRVTVSGDSYNHSIRFSDPTHIRLPKFGPMKLLGSTRKVRRMIDDGRFHVYSATLNERAGRWFVSLTGVASQLHQSERSRRTRLQVPVGVDRGIKSLCVAADANGAPFEIFEGVKTLREAQSKLKAANQALARTTPGSKGRQRARARLAKTHRKIANTRRHLVHQVSKTLVHRAQVLVLEDLNVAGMAKNRLLAMSIADAAMGELARQIRYKAKWHDVEIRMANRYFPSSKTCSGCGEVKGDLTLAERKYACTKCGLIIDRDLNAAINLARWQPKVDLATAPPTSTSELILSTA